MGRKTQEREAQTAPLPRRRRPWNTSTRLTEDRGTAVVDGGDGDEGQGSRHHRHHDRETAVDKPSHAHSRCSSPTCQRRRTTAAPTTTATSTSMSVAVRRDLRTKGSAHVATTTLATTQEPPPPLRSPANATRAMIERAFDAAFVKTMDDPELTAVDASLDASSAGTPEKKKRIKDQSTVAALTDADAVAKQWRAHYVRRRDQKQRAADARLARETKVAEFQRGMRAARVEYEQRKLAIQSLQSRLQREMQFLEATAAELSRRESLLDDAFDGYELWLRRELEGTTTRSNARAG